MSGARTRLLRFFVVGLIGFALQLVVLVLLTRAAVPYVLAAVIAVEVTIVHNFLWHEQWTWRDRSTTTMRERWRRLARFNGASALTSIAGNALGTFAFVELGHLPVALANTLAVVLVSALNFALADRWAFTRSRPQRDGTGAAESTGSGWPVPTMSDTLTRWTRLAPRPLPLGRDARLAACGRSSCSSPRGASRSRRRRIRRRQQTPPASPSSNSKSVWTRTSSCVEST